MKETPGVRAEISRNISDLRDEIGQLKKRNDDLVLVVAALAEQLRRVDHLLALGNLSDRLPIGFFDLVVDTDEGQQHPPTLNMAVDVAGTIVRVRFDNGTGNSAAEKDN